MNCKKTDAFFSVVAIHEVANIHSTYVVLTFFN